MRRTFSLLLLILLTVPFAGCTSTETGSVFEYRDKLREATAEIAFSEEVYKVKWTFNNAETIEILSPDSIAGCSFTLEDGITYASYGDMNIPLSEELASGILPLFELFELSDEDIISISKTEEGKTEVSASCDVGEYKFFQNAEGLPEKVVLSGTRNFEGSNFEFVLADSQDS